MNLDNGAFESLAFNLENLETILLSKVRNFNEKLFNDSVAE